MGVRAIRVKIVCDQKTLEHLWQTHKLFNDQLRVLLGKLFAMRRGDLGVNMPHKRACKKWMDFVLERGAKDAPYLLNAVSIPKWKPATALKMLSWKTSKDHPDLKKSAARGLPARGAQIIDLLTGYAIQVISQWSATTAGNPACPDGATNGSP